jgi:hypothetical protein
MAFSVIEAVPVGAGRSIPVFLLLFAALTMPLRPRALMK